MKISEKTKLDPNILPFAFFLVFLFLPTLIPTPKYNFRDLHYHFHGPAFSLSGPALLLPDRHYHFRDLHYHFQDLHYCFQTFIILP